MHRFQAQNPTLVGVGVRGRQAGGNGVDLVLCLLDRATVGKAPKDTEVVVATALRVAVVVQHGEPQLDPGAVVEVGRQHADNLICGAADRDAASHDIGIAAVATLPKTVAENHDLGGAAVLFLQNERAPDLRLDSEHREEVVGHLR